MAGLALVTYSFAEQQPTAYRFDPNNPQPPPPGERIDSTQQRAIEAYVWRELETIRAAYGYHGGGIEAFSKIMRLYSYEPFLRLGTEVHMQINAGAGNRLRRLGGERFATIFYERGLAGALATRPLDTLDVYLFATETAHSAFKLDQYTKAIKRYKSIYKYAQNWDQLYTASTLNNIGLTYLEASATDSAQHYFESALHKLEQLPESKQNELSADLAYAITDNLGLIQLKAQHYDAALDYFESNVNAVDTTIRDGYYLHRKPQALYRIATVKLQTGDLRAAKRLIKRVKTYETRIYEAHRRTFRRRIHEFELRLLIAKYGSDRQTAALDAYIQLRDDMDNERQRALNEVYALHGRVKTQELAEASRLRLKATEQRNAAIYQQRLNTTVFVLIVVLVLAGGGAVFYIRNQRMRSERKLLEAQAKQERLERENVSLQLRNREKDLQAAAQYLSLQERLTEGFLEKLDALRNAKPEDYEQHLLQVILELQALKPTEEKTHEFAKNINAVSSAFKDKLREDYPNLSEKDLELCGLIRLGLDAKAQALMRGISEQGIRKARYRLSKKLNLDNGADLDLFIRTI